MNFIKTLIRNRGTLRFFNSSNTRNICELHPCIRLVKKDTHNAHRKELLYSFTVAFSLTKLYEIVGLDENKEIKKMVQKAKHHLGDGEIDEACQVFNKALLAAVASHDEEHEFMIKEHLAKVSFFLKKYEDAEKLFVEVRNHFISKGLQLDDLKMAYVNLKLAELYGFMKDETKAHEYYKYCTKGLKKKITDALRNRDDEVISLWIMSLTSRAHFSTNRGSFDKAYKYFKKAYDACLLIHGELSEHAVTLLQRMGVVCFQIGNLELAVEYLKKATELGKHLPGMEKLSNAHITLGNIYIKQGFLKDATAMCTEGYKNAVRHKYEQGIQEANACLEELKRATS